MNPGYNDKVVVGVPLSLSRYPSHVNTVHECKNKCGTYLASDLVFCGNCRCVALHCRLKRLTGSEYCANHLSKRSFF